MNAYRDISKTLEFVETLGEVITRSKIFGCDFIEQGKVLALECITRGVTPLSLAERYHLIGGDLSMKSDAMLADFRGIGGRHKIEERTADRAAIILEIDGESVQFALTWEEAQLEPFTRRKRKSTDPGSGDYVVKDNYKTPRSRMQMLWARVVSDGVRAIAPEVVCGHYTPEETSDYTGAPIRLEDHSSAVETVEVEAADPAREEIERAQAAAKAAIAAEAKLVASKKEEPASLDAERQKIVHDLFDQMGLSDSIRAAILSKRGVGAIPGLSTEQADEIIANCREKLERSSSENAAPADPEIKDEIATRTENTREQCEAKIAELVEDLRAAGLQDVQVLPEEAKTIRLLLVENNQRDASVGPRAREKILGAGLQSLDGLTREEANRAIAFLEAREIEQFFQMSLEGFEARNKE